MKHKEVRVMETATAKVRVSAFVSETDWRRLRDLAERDRLATGRASVAAILARLIARELATSDAGKA